MHIVYMKDGRPYLYEYTSSSLCRLGIAIPRGSLWDVEEKRPGISHLLEHMVFRTQLEVDG